MMATTAPAGETDARGPGSDKPGQTGLQAGAAPSRIAEGGHGPLWDWAQARRGLRLRTLVMLRWAAIAGQLIAVLGVAYGLHFPLPTPWCLLVIAVAAGMNLSVTLSWPGMQLAGEREAILQLAFDLVELAVLLDLPFCLLLVAPVTVAATVLPVRYAIGLGTLGLVAVVVLGLWSGPLPWTAGTDLEFPQLYQIGNGLAVATGIVFTAAYAWQASAEAQRMELALAATQAVLAREQRLSALGGLAAAAAHELGTPLATIQVVTKEMARELAPGPLADDVQLLMSQAERCRAILKKLSQAPDTADAHHARMGLSQLLDEIAEPYRGDVILIDGEVTCAPGASILEIKRLPEVMHGLSAFVENATDFAESIVELTAHYDADRLLIEVRDDGPGFPLEVMSRLGQPYVTTRSHGENSRSHHQGMGLGFFIAKTLLERTGAQVEFRNARRGGAVISARWRRDRIEAPEVA
jgi:two-component system sensor histidine kinase RegB